MGSGADVCEDCGGSTWKPSIDADGRSVVVRCDCFLQRLQRHAWNVPEWAKDAELSNYQTTAGNRVALAAGKEWLKGKRQDLFYFGGVGRGKTRLGCSLLNEAFRAGYPTARYISIAYFMWCQVQGIDDPAWKIEAGQLARQALEADPVFFDDLAAGEKNSDFTRRTLNVIYDERLQKGRRSIWASNLDLGSLAEFYNDDRFASRIAGAAVEMIELKGEDHRLPGARR